jgi:hypothetical protein
VMTWRQPGIRLPDSHLLLHGFGSTMKDSSWQ